MGCSGRRALRFELSADADALPIQQRADAAALRCRERAVAVTADGGRVFTDAAPDYGCYSGPSFEIDIHDASTGRLVDVLPPGPSSLDALATTVAYGTELWCAR